MYRSRSHSPSAVPQRRREAGRQSLRRSASQQQATWYAGVMGTLQPEHHAWKSVTMPPYRTPPVHRTLHPYYTHTVGSCAYYSPRVSLIRDTARYHTDHYATRSRSAYDMISGQLNLYGSAARATPVYGGHLSSLSANYRPRHSTGASDRGDASDPVKEYRSYTIHTVHSPWRVADSAISRSPALWQSRRNAEARLSSALSRGNWSYASRFY